MGYITITLPAAIPVTGTFVRRIAPPFGATEGEAPQMLTAAVELGRIGYQVFPAPHREGMKPPVGWPQRASDESDALRKLWSGHEHYHVGLLAGERGAVTVIDVDVRDGKPGRESLAALEAELGSLGNPTVVTGSGGNHYYFQFERLTESADMCGKLAPGIDVKGCGPGGTFVYAPPTHRTKPGHTEAYRWTNGIPHVDRLPRLPAKWRHKIERAAKAGGELQEIPEDDPRLVDIPSGIQNDRIYLGGVWKWRRGASEEELWSYMLKLGERCAPPFTDETRLRDTWRSICRNVKQFDPEYPRTSTGLADALEALDWRTRWNERRDVDEWRYRDGPWRPLDDPTEERIREHLKLSFKDKQGNPYWHSPEKWRHLRFAMVDANRVDPFLAWLEALEWDGESRIDTILAKAFGSVDCTWTADPTEEDRERNEAARLNSWASRYCFMAPAQRALQPGCKLDEMLVFYSEVQGVGKGTFIAALAPWEDLFTRHFDLAARDKEVMEAIAGVAIVEAEELQGWNLANLEKLKAFISRREDRVRFAYRRNVSYLPRRFAMFGSTNNPQCLPNDPSGNRRFVVLKVTRGPAPPEAFMTEERVAQCYAEAMVRLKRGETASLPADLEAARDRRALIYRDRDDIVEETLAEWLATHDAMNMTKDRAGNRKCHGFTLAAALRRVREDEPRATQGRVTRALTNAGFISDVFKVEGKAVRRWQPVRGEWFTRWKRDAKELPF